MPFNPALVTDIDHLRLAVGDTADPSWLDDVTYQALLTQAGGDYTAALPAVFTAVLAHVGMLASKMSADAVILEYADRLATLRAGHAAAQRAAQRHPFSGAPRGSTTGRVEQVF